MADKNEKQPKVRVYFDEDAEARDGFGWTVDNGGAVVLRYKTEAVAREVARILEQAH